MTNKVKSCTEYSNIRNFSKSPENKEFDIPSLENVKISHNCNQTCKNTMGRVV